MHTHRLNWIEVLGTKYMSGGVVILSGEPDYSFGLIVDVVVFDVDNYFLVCEILNTDCFNAHLHAFEVSHSVPHAYSFVKQTNLADHSVLGLYKKGGNMFIVLKYLVVK